VLLLDCFEDVLEELAELLVVFYRLTSPVFCDQQDDLLQTLHYRLGLRTFAVGVQNFICYICLKLLAVEGEAVLEIEAIFIAEHLHLRLLGIVQKIPLFEFEPFVPEIPYEFLGEEGVPQQTHEHARIQKFLIDADVLPGEFLADI
jgi:hypothetical protein